MNIGFIKKIIKFSIKLFNLNKNEEKEQKMQYK